MADIAITDRRKWLLRLPGDVPRSVRIIACLCPLARDLGDLELALAMVDLGVSPLIRLGAWGLRRARRIRAGLTRRLARWIR